VVAQHAVGFLEAQYAVPHGVHYLLIDSCLTDKGVGIEPSLAGIAMPSCLGVGYYQGLPRQKRV